MEVVPNRGGNRHSFVKSQLIRIQFLALTSLMFGPGLIGQLLQLFRGFGKRLIPSLLRFDLIDDDLRNCVLLGLRKFPRLGDRLFKQFCHIGTISPKHDIAKTRRGIWHWLLALFQAYVQDKASN